MAGAPDALQPAGHRWRRLHLDDQIDRAHVDAELQARGGDHSFEPTALEVVLDLGAGLLADRAVVSSGEERGSAERLPTAHDVGRCTTTDLRIEFVGQLEAAAGRMNF